MNMKLRDYQNDAIDLIKQEIRNGMTKIMLFLATGGGKCHAAGTGILMHNGSIKKVEDISVGDFVMGENSNPRKVLSLCRGREKMYKITPVKGMGFIFNESHIMTLRCSFTRAGYKKGQLVDVSIKDYLKLTKERKRQFKWTRTGVDFPFIKKDY